jgi:hypothetical protein
MEPPAVLAQDGLTFRTATPTRNCEQQTLAMTAAGSDGMDLVQLQALDRILLAPKVRGFFEAYLAADDVRRAEFRKAAAYASHRFGFDPPATPTLQDDVAAAVAIARKAADIAYANDFGQMIDGGGLGFIDFALLADACATLALGYRCVVGSYVTDSTLSDLGEAAVRFVLLSEREHDSALSENRVPAVSSVPTSDAFGQNQELSSTLSVFEPPAARGNEEVAGSLDAISRRLKDEILLIA